MTATELKAAMREYIFSSDAFTSNSPSNIFHAIELLIDELSGEGEGGGLTPGIDKVLEIGGVLTTDRYIDLGGFNLAIQSGKFLLNTMQDFADNAAALAGGVPSGGFYYTTNGTEREVKQAHD